jgi:hypothetical protein
MNCPIHGCGGQAELQYRVADVYGEGGVYECLECHETFEAEIEEEE